VPVRFRERVFDLVRRVPPGRVVSYGAVAAMIGRPRAARAVGTALARLDDDGVPWWRVVDRHGRVPARPAAGAVALQRALLEGEGVRFDGDGCIDWKSFGWEGEEATG
jgi:methylated-DNA-protein-cysteine methyltransferase related protein